MTVGFHSPMPPARTGVADYSAALLTELRRHGRVELAGSASAQCDVALYHLGNNGLHASIYQRALERPGVVVLHDAVLHHFLLGQLGEAAYIEEFVYNYGEWNRSLAADLWRRRAASGSDSRYFACPMLKRAVESALAVVVHNPAAAQIARDHAPGARIVEIPHLFQPPGLPTAAEALRYRQKLGVVSQTFLFAVFGYLRESKRLMAVLDAFAEVRRELPQAGLLVAGEFVSSDLERAAGPRLKAPGIVRLPYLSERDFWRAACAADACINLRYPAAGETSGIAIRLMGIGKPVMLTDSAEWSRIPDGCCIRIASGTGERLALREHMVLLLSMESAARDIGRRGAAHIHANHGVDHIGAQYWDLLRELSGA